MNLRDHPRERVGPRLDPYAVFRVPERAVLDVETIDWLLIWGPPQAADADPMARATVDPCHVDVIATIADRDAVVARHDVCVSDVDPGGLANVDAVSVDAVVRGCDCEVVELEVLAPEYVDVEVLAVLCCYVFDQGICDEVEPQILSDPAKSNISSVEAIGKLF